MRRKITVINNPINNNYNVFQYANGRKVLHDWVTASGTASGTTFTLASATDFDKIDVGDVVVGGSLPTFPAVPATVVDKAAPNIIELSAAPGAVTSLTFGRPVMVVNEGADGANDTYVQGSLVWHNPQNANNAPNAGTVGVLNLNPTVIATNLSGQKYSFSVYRMIDGEAKFFYGQGTTFSAQEVQDALASFFGNTAIGAQIITNTPGLFVVHFPLPNPMFAFQHNGGVSGINSITPGAEPTGLGTKLIELYDADKEKEYGASGSIVAGNVYRIYYATLEVPVKAITGTGKEDVEAVILVNNANTTNANSYHTRLTAVFT